MCRHHDSQRINAFYPFLQCTSLFSKTVCQVVAHRRLKTIENSKTVGRNSGRGRLREVVVYKRFQCKALTEDIFDVLGRWSLMRGGRLRVVVARGGLTVFENLPPHSFL